MKLHPCFQSLVFSERRRKAAVGGGNGTECPLCAFLKKASGPEGREEAGREGGRAQAGPAVLPELLSSGSSFAVLSLI